MHNNAIVTIFLIGGTCLFIAIPLRYDSIHSALSASTGSRSAALHAG